MTTNTTAQNRALWKRYTTYDDPVERVRLDGELVNVDIALGADNDKWRSLEVCNRVHRIANFYVFEDPERFVLRYYDNDDDDDMRIFGKVYFGRKTEGPANHVHGGALCTVLDHLLGRTPYYVFNEKRHARGKDIRLFLVASISVQMKASVPVESVQYFETKITNSDGGRKTTVYGRIYDATNDKTFAEGTAINIEIPRQRYKTMLASRL